jgi:3alpha(or 20beta)-hydroxysteroid dehydrogenase
MGRVDGKVAVISGGARGMGAAHARALVGEGAKVVIGDILDDEGKALATELGDAARYVHLDVTQPSEWEAAVSAAVDDFGKLNVLVNNAGIVALGQLGQFNVDKWNKVIDVNLNGTFHGIQAAIEPMKAAGGGSIINVSSTGAVRPTRDIVPYAAAKAGVNAMTVGLAHAFGPSVRVNAIMPGPFLTTIARGWDMDVFAERARTFPARRAGEADEIVGAALYLASGASSYTTGTVLTVDGGAQWSMAGTGDASAS